MRNKYLIKSKRDTIDGYAFIAPSLIIIGLFVLVPAIRLVYLSFFDANIMGKIVFSGLDNYASLFSSRDFFRSFMVTLRFMVMVVGL